MYYFIIFFNSCFITLNIHIYIHIHTHSLYLLLNLGDKSIICLVAEIKQEFEEVKMKPDLKELKFHRGRKYIVVAEALSQTRLYHLLP